MSDDKCADFDDTLRTMLDTPRVSRKREDEQDEDDADVDEGEQAVSR